MNHDLTKSTSTRDKYLDVLWLYLLLLLLFIFLEWIFSLSSSLSRYFLINCLILRYSFGWRGGAGLGWVGLGEVHSETTKKFYTNAQHSNVLTQKSSSGLRGSLPKVLQVCERPWFKSPSSHRPNRPLKQKQKKFQIISHHIKYITRIKNNNIHKNISNQYK